MNITNFEILLLQLQIFTVLFLQIQKTLKIFLFIKEKVFLMRINLGCCKPRRWVGSRSRDSPDRNSGGGCCIYGGGGSSSLNYSLHQGNSLRARSSYLSKSRSRRWPVDLCSTVKRTSLYLDWIYHNTNKKTYQISFNQSINEKLAGV